MCDHFLSMPQQLELKIQQWKDIAGDNLSVDYITSYTGHKVYALTLTGSSSKSLNKRTHYIAQPHAHEPATTAGMVDIIEQLVTGYDLTGKEAKFDIEKALATTVLTFNPIGNPYGRERSPVTYWDGTRYTNNQLHCTMRGEDPEDPGRYWKRLPLWDIRSIKAPNPIGIVYEPIDDYRYVEPNRSHLSSYFRLFNKLNKIHNYVRWLDLHQQEFENSPYTCEVLLPMECGIPQNIQESNAAWAEGISIAWRQEGYSVNAPRQIGYVGEQAKYLRDAWEDIYRKINVVNVEIKNNSSDFPPALQLNAQSVAIATSIMQLMQMK